MKKRLLLSIFVIVLFNYSYSQNPQWVWKGYLGKDTTSTGFTKPIYKDAITTDTAGNFYVINEIPAGFSAGHYIQKYTSDAKLISQIFIANQYSPSLGGFPDLQDIAVDYSGNIYVIDIDQCIIRKFDTKGNLIRYWGKYGTGNSQFNLLEGIAVDKYGAVYVADGGNNRIQKFDSTGAFIMSWGIKGSTNGKFDQPTDVSVDTAGYVYVYDYTNKRIQKFTFLGVFVSSFASAGRFLTSDMSGNTYIYENYAIKKYDANGSPILQWGTKGLGNNEFGVSSSTNYETRMYATADFHGNILIADPFRIQRFDLNGNFIICYTSGGVGNGEFYSPGEITIDRFDNVYVADIGRIQKFNAAGDFIKKIDTSALGTQFTPAFTVDTALNIYTNDGYSIRTFDSNFVFVNRWYPPYYFYYMYGQMAIDLDNILYIPCTAGIYRFTKDGTYIDQKFYSNITSCHGAFVDEKRNFYELEDGHSHVLKFDSKGKQIAEIQTAAYDPTNFAVNKYGEMAISYDASVIKYFDAAGNQYTPFWVWGSNNRQFMYPRGIAFNSHGDMYIADNNNNRVQIYENMNITKVEDSPKQTTAVIYPNPANNMITIRGTQHKEYTVFNSLGEVVLTTTNSSIDIRDLANGIYFLKAENDFIQSFIKY